ncbi:MAG: LytR/AlgR family response regulator transcription factor, partial [Pseudoalteromonas spongiae]
MNVLIVDDEPLARARIARLLQKLRPDFNIMSLAENAEQALLACSDLVPDLALLDIEMPGLSGIELAEKLKEFNPPPAIIFITAYPDKALPAFAVAPQGYLVKPIDEVALAKAIDGLKISHRA